MSWAPGRKSVCDYAFHLCITLCTFLSSVFLSEDVSGIHWTILIVQNSVALPERTTWWHHKIMHGFRVQLACGGALKEPPAMRGAGKNRSTWEFLVKLYFPN